MSARMYWVMSLAVFGLLFGASLVSRLPANALVQTSELDQPSIMVDRLTANTRNLPVQSFDAF